MDDTNTAVTAAVVCVKAACFIAATMPDTHVKLRRQRLHPIPQLLRFRLLCCKLVTGQPQLQEIIISRAPASAASAAAAGEPRAAVVLEATHGTNDCFVLSCASMLG
jgi:hypothetical protein